MILARQYLNGIQSWSANDFDKGYKNLMILLHQARNDLRMRTVGSSNVVVSNKMVFDYFDEIRKVIEVAKNDILFVDPYLDAEFVARYLPHVAPG